MPVKLLLFFTLLLLVVGSHPLWAQHDSFIKDYLERWETSRQYMLSVAEAMPENAYTFKPTTQEMSFAQHLMHIAAVIDWHAFSKADGQEYKPRWEAFKEVGRSKQEMMKLVNQEFERAAKLVAGFDPALLDETGSYGKYTRSRRQFLLLMADHVTHHRTQMIVYLRLKGIKPPNYIEFQ